MKSLGKVDFQNIFQEKERKTEKYRCDKKRKVTGKGFTGVVQERELPENS